MRHYAQTTAEQKESRSPEAPADIVIMFVLMSKKLAIAMFGQKRLSREGGVEIVVKELCTRMAQNGCDVTCYNRAGHHVSGA